MPSRGSTTATPAIGIDVNNLSDDELRAELNALPMLLPENVVQAIFERRPFRKKKDLLSVRGLGRKRAASFLITPRNDVPEDLDALLSWMYNVTMHTMDAPL